jgi:hypothetical protein
MAIQEENIFEMMHDCPNFVLEWFHCSKPLKFGQIDDCAILVLYLLKFCQMYNIIINIISKTFFCLLMKPKFGSI